MLKLSISLPNSTQITLESEEPAVIHEVLLLVLRNGVAVDAAPQSVPAAPAPAANGHHTGAEKSNDVTPPPPPDPSPAPAPYPPANGAAAHSPANGAAPAAPAVPAVSAAPAAPAVPAVPAAPAAPVSAAGYPPPTAIAPAPHPLPAAAGYAAPLAAPGGFAVPTLPPGEADDDGLLLESQPQAALDDFVAFCQSVNPMGDMRRVVVAAEGAGRFFRAEGVNADELGELFDLAGWRRANSFTQTLRNAARSKFGWLERIPGRSGRYAATDLGRSVTLGG